MMHLLELPFERVTVDTLANETRTPEFLLLNPNGKVPTLKLPHGAVLAESNAMLWYLAEDTPFLPDSRLQRAQVLQWMFFEHYSHEPYIATLRNWIGYANKRDEYASEIAAFRPKGYAALNVMEQHLGSRTNLVGEAYSIADIALYAYTYVAHEGEFDLDNYVAICRWLRRIEKEPRHIAIDWRE